MRGYLCSGDVAVGGSESEFTRDLYDLVEVQADGGSGLLRDLVLDGDVEVVGTVEEALKRALVLG